MPQCDFNDNQDKTVHRKFGERSRRRRMKEKNTHKTESEKEKETEKKTFNFPLSHYGDNAKNAKIRSNLYVFFFIFIFS